MTQRITENLFLEIGELLNSSLDRVTILRSFCNRLLALYDAERVSILFLDAAGQNLILTAWAGRYPEDMDEIRIPLGEGVAGWVAATGDAVLVTDVDEDIRFSVRPGDRYRTKSFISVPLKSRGKLLGVLNITDTAMNKGFNEENLVTLKTLALQAGMGMENLSLIDDLEGISFSGTSLTLALQEIQAGSRDIESGLIPAAVRGAREVLGPASHMILVGEMGGNRAWAGVTGTDTEVNLSVMDFGSGYAIYQEMAALPLHPPFRENPRPVELGFSWKLLHEGGFRLLRSLLPPRASLFGILLSIIPECSAALEESRKASQTILTRFSGMVLEGILDRQMIQKLDNLKTELISTVSHELRTPLTSIQGFSEFLIRSRDVPGHLERYLHIINNESRRLGRLINDFLDLARFESGQLTLTKEPFDPLEVVESAVRLLNLQAESIKATVRIHVDGELSNLIADRDRVEQALVNLIANSIQYGGQGVEIEIGLYQDEERTIFEISDNGPGIPEEELPLIFNRFFRGTPAGENEDQQTGPKGTGLGLSLTKEIIQRHGGTISAASVPGRKTFFQFSLPTLGLVSPHRGMAAWHPGDEEFTAELANRLAEGKTVGILTVHVNPSGDFSGFEDPYSVEAQGEMEEILLGVINDGEVRDNYIKGQPRGQYVILTYASLVDRYADHLMKGFQEKLGARYHLAIGAAASAQGEKPRPEKLIALSRQACIHVEKTGRSGYLKNRRM
ncbi:MAG: GAF domain-containing sensor histidine kinase [Proteobacteria bacterium]|nr:GAF domain-containing sensor histidine kinase [Pseudomonadota bacterium]